MATSAPSANTPQGAVSARGNRTIPCGEFPVIMWVDMRRRLALAAALLVTTGSGTWAGPPTDHLHGRIDRVLKALAAPSLKNDATTTQRLTTPRGTADGTFDFTE